VAVGDPITLTLTVGGTGRLDVLQAPDLAGLPELTKAFKIPDEPLAGVVEDGKKTFTVSLRPKNDRVKQIPSIPLVFFDPTLEKFVTSRSEPIAIRVDTAEKLAMSKIVSSMGKPVAPRKERVEKVDGINANYVGDGRLLGGNRMFLGWPLFAALVTPPVVFCALLAGKTWRNTRNQTARQRNAGPKARGRLGEAKLVDDVALALTQYVADRIESDASSMTPEEAIGKLRCVKVSEESIEASRSVLMRCEELRYSRGSREDVVRLIEQGKDCVGRLEKESWEVKK
jgi:hypothetical protein